MKLPHSANSILSQIYFMVPPASFRSAAPVVGAEMLKQPKADYFDEVDKMLGIPAMTVDNGVACIPVRGILAQNVSRMDRWYGFWGYEQIISDLTAAEADAKVKAVVLVIDSPGGQATGALETATRIASCTKPVIAFTPGLMASAAYYIARGAGAVLAAPSAIVGSIGTYMTIEDFSAYCEEMGVGVKVLKSGEHKGAGEFGTSLTPGQEAALQNIVDTLGGQFRQFVSMRAPGLKPEHMDGQAFVGTEALDIGMVDDLTTLEECKSFALEMAQGLKIT